MNQKIDKDNSLLRSLVITPEDSPVQQQEKIQEMQKWYDANKGAYVFDPTTIQRWCMLILDTRFCRYMNRILTLDFGTLRNDDNKNSDK